MARRRGGWIWAVLAALVVAAGTASTLLVGGGPGAAPRGGAGGGDGARPFPTGSGGGRAEPQVLGPVGRIAPARADAPASLLVRLHPGATGPLGPGATVEVLQSGRSARATAGVPGEARFESLPPGAALLRASMPGYVARAANVSLAPGLLTEVHLRLFPAVPVEGRVVRDDDGAPVAGAELRLDRDSGFRPVPAPPTPPDATSAADGSFRLEGGVAGTEGILHASAPGLVDTEGGLPIRFPGDAKDIVRVEIRLTPEGEIAGVVRGPDGAPVAEARVAAAAPPGPIDLSIGGPRRAGVVRPRGSVGGTLSGPDGTFRIAGLARGGRYGVSAERGDWVLQGPPPEVVLPARDGDAQVELVLGPPGSLVVTWDPAAAGGRARVRCFEAGPDRRDAGRDAASSDPPERFALPPGRYLVTLESPGGFATATTTVVSGGETTLALDIDGGDLGPCLAGVVEDGEGRPIPGARVEVLSALPGPAADPPAPAARPPLFSEPVQVAMSGRSGPMYVLLAGLREPGAAIAEWRAAGSTVRADALGRFRVPAFAGGFREGDEAWVRARLDAPAADGGLPGAGRGPAAAGPFRFPSAGIRLVLPARAAVRGRIVLPPGAAADSFTVHYAAGSDGTTAGGIARLGASGLKAHLPFRADGRFEVGDLPAGPGTLRLSGADWYVPVPVDLPAGATADLGDFAVAALRAVRGRVVDAGGRPVAGAQVRFADGGPTAPREIAAADGTFSISGAPPGDALRVLAEGFLPTTVPIGGEETVVTMRRGGTVLVTARDAAGRPAAGWEVRATSEGLGSTSVFRVDPRGRCELLLESGAWSLVLRGPGAAASAGPVRVEVVDEARVELELSAGR